MNDTTRQRNIEKMREIMAARKDKFGVVGTLTQQLAKAVMGVDVPIVAPLADQACVIICGDYSHGRLYFADNVTGPCDWCGTPLQWRPESPKGEHVCINCAHERRNKDN